MMFERVEGRVKRPQRVAEEAVLGLSRRRRRVSRHVMGALVVRDEYWRAFDVRVVDVRQRQTAGAHAYQQEERDTGVPDPRLTAEHRFQLSD